MDVKTGFFYLFALVMLFAAFRVITARNPVHAVLFLMLTFSQAAGIWLLLEAEFLAIVLVLVYVGAVMVLFLFVIMLLDLKVEERRKLKVLGVVGGLVSVGSILAIFLTSLWNAPLGASDSPAIEGGTVRLGKLLFTQYLLPFEIVSLILLVAMVGVVLLSKKDLK